MTEIVDVFRTIVASVSDALGYDVHFYHGHRIEVSNSISDIERATNNADDTMPAIWLLHDFDQDEVFGGTKAKITFFILAGSDPKYSSTDREENVFKPFLVPIYNEFKKQIQASKYVVEFPKGDKAWPRIDHYFYGSESVMGNVKLITNSWVDCIELNQVELKIAIPCTEQGETITYPRAEHLLTGATGEYVYAIFTVPMSTPAGAIAESFTAYQDGAEILFQGCYVEGSTSIYVLQVANDTPIQPGLPITMNIASGIIQSAAGVMLQSVSGLTVVNNYPVP